MRDDTKNGCVADYKKKKKKENVKCMIVYTLFHKKKRKTAPGCSFVVVEFNKLFKTAFKVTDLLTYVN